MNTELSWKELVRLPIAQMQDVLLARFTGRGEAIRLGFSPVVLTRIATAISEISRNVVQHAGCAGELRVSHAVDGARVGLQIVVSDPGKGIGNPQRLLETRGIAALGAGLTGTAGLVDQFDIRSAPGMGTTVTMEFWHD